MGKMLDRIQNSSEGDTLSAFEVIERVATRNDSACHRKCLMHTVIVLGELLTQHMNVVNSMAEAFDTMEADLQENLDENDATKAFRQSLFYIREHTAQLMDMPTKDAVGIMIRARQNGVTYDS